MKTLSIFLFSALVLTFANGCKDKNDQTPTNAEMKSADPANTNAMNQTGAESQNSASASAAGTKTTTVEGATTGTGSSATGTTTTSSTTTGPTNGTTTTQTHANGSGTTVTTTTVKTSPNSTTPSMVPQTNNDPTRVTPVPQNGGTPEDNAATVTVTKQVKHTPSKHVRDSIKCKKAVLQQATRLFLWIQSGCSA
jgi:hypothetical protein